MTMLTEPHAPWLRDLSFERSLRVPRGLDPGSVEAELADGVLTLRIPKPEELEPRRVEIKTASSSSQPQELQESAP
jgi:hypothetical protein